MYILAMGDRVDRTKVLLYFHADDFLDMPVKLQQFLVTHSKCNKCESSPILKQAYCENCKNKGITSDIFYVDSESWNQICTQLKKDENNKKKSANRNYHLKTVSGFYTTSDIQQIWDFQNGKCHYCGIELGSPETKHAFEKDHIVPISKSGTEWPSNIALTCRQCNQLKNNLSSQAFWRLLEKEYDKNWVLDRKKIINEVTRKKTKLTEIRQLELENKIKNIEIELNKIYEAKRFERGLPKSEYEPAIEIEIDFKYWIKISLVEAAIELVLPPLFNRKLNKLKEKALDDIVNCLFTLDS